MPKCIPSKSYQFSQAGCLPIFWFVLKETRGDVILAKRAKKFRKEGRNAYAKSELNKDNVFEMLKVSFKRPTKMLLTEYTVASFTVSQSSQHSEHMYVY